MTSKERALNSVLQEFSGHAEQIVSELADAIREAMDGPNGVAEYYEKLDAYKVPDIDDPEGNVGRNVYVRYCTEEEEDKPYYLVAVEGYEDDPMTYPLEGEDDHYMSTIMALEVAVFCFANPK